MKREVNYWKYFWIVLVCLIIIGIVAYLYIAAPERCDNDECFFKALATCTEAKYASFGNISFDYTIRGREADSCVVNAKLLRSYWRGKTFETLRGKSMDCYLDFGKLVFPDQDLDKCHGPLKESLQDLILQKLQGYVIDVLSKSA